MKTLQVNLLLLIWGLISCNAPTRNSEKSTIDQTIKSKEKEESAAVESIKNGDTQTKVQIEDTVLHHTTRSNKKSNKKIEKTVEDVENLQIPLNNGLPRCPQPYEDNQ